MAKKVLVIGSGGREHALAWKLAASPQVAKVYAAPGNGGIAQHASCITLESAEEIIRFCKDEAIDLVVIGPEQPLVDGLGDTLRAAGLSVFGPSEQAAALEASKQFTNDLCRKYAIPSGGYESFTDAASAKAYVQDHPLPIVVKADGLAAGKGVVIAESVGDAEAAIDEMFSGKFGAAGETVVIEEFLDGEEVSFFALSDGKDAVSFGYAQDHKRAFDGDKGPNTGGMGTYSPAPIMSDVLHKQIMETIIYPSVAAMANEEHPFSGVLFAGLMITAKGPQLLEYNVRFGDPETQVLMRLLESDLYEVLSACANGTLGNMDIKMSNRAGVCVVMAANGYPEAYEKGTEIKGLEKADAMDEVVVFHAGTKADSKKMLANGGRVLGVTAIGDSLQEAQQKAYAAVDVIDWPQGFCRRDIGWRALGNATKQTASA